MCRWLLSLLLVTAVASAALIEPALQEQMARVDGSERIGVVIALKDQLDGQAIIQTVKDKQQRWEMTVTSLKAMAERDQAGLISLLQAKAAAGKVTDIQSMWIVNAVYCEATREVIRQVANRDEVWFVQWNLIPTDDALAIAGNNPAARDVTDGAYTVEWNVQKVKADSVWYVYGYTGEGVIVGHIDTGCDYTHPDLSGHMWVDPNYPHYGWNFEQNNNDPMDAQGHGTHTAGTVAGDGTGGDSTGMAPHAQTMVCRTKTSLGSPLPDTVAENTVMNAMQFCVAPPLSPTHHAQLLTMSLGWLHSWTPRRALWRDCVTNVAAAGLPYFIANGNEGSSSPPDNVRTPGDCPNPYHHPAEPDGGRSGAISIGATTSSDDIASFSSWGPVSWTGIVPYDDYPYPPGLYKPDFSAPGENVTSCRLGGGYTQMSGTSMATPCAAGVCALILEKNPTLLPEDVSEIMQNSVLPLGTQPKNNTFGTGRIDAMLCIANTPAPGPFHDVALDRILAPAPKIDPLTPLAPVVVVKNRGTFPEPNVAVHCRVDSLGTAIYNQTSTITLLDSAGVDTVTFPNWNVGPGSQTYDLWFWHTYVPDTNHRNDTLRRQTITRGHDVSVAGMNIGGRVRANAIVTPRISLRSTDYTEHDFEAWCRIDSAGTQLYFDSTAVDSVPEQGMRSFEFPSSWSVGPSGAQYHVTMYHNCPPDQNRRNDTLQANTTATEQIRVLWIYSDYDVPDTTLGIRLVALGDSVEYFDGQTGTPTLEQLSAYDAVGAHSNYPYVSPDGLGNVLADYVDAGGGVVMANFSYTSGWEMAGRIMTGDYATINPGDNTHAASPLGWFNPAHAIMNGVTSVQDQFMAGGTFVSTAESVARWTDGRPYVAVSANQKVAGCNMYPGTYSYPERQGDWALVIHNALNFVAGAVSGVNGFDPLAPALHVALSAAPNPAQFRAVVNYAAPNAGSINISFYDQSGRLVRTLFAGRVKAGINQLVWDLKDNNGRRAAKGVYFCKLVAGDETLSRKLVVR
jgi:serine protease AprX